MRDITMASRAGSTNAEAASRHNRRDTPQVDPLKNAPRITKRTLQVDWERFLLYVELIEMEEEEVVNWLPLAMESDLFCLYQQAAKREGVRSLSQAWQLLASLVGVKKNSS